MATPADVLQRIFAIDALAYGCCPRLIAIIEDPVVVDCVLRHVCPDPTAEPVPARPLLAPADSRALAFDVFA